MPFFFAAGDRIRDHCGRRAGDRLALSARSPTESCQAIEQRYQACRPAPAEDDAENLETAQVYLLIGHFSPEPPKVRN